MRWSRFGWGVALALFFVAALVVYAPARLLGLVLPAEQVVMTGFEGTLWRGGASRCLLRLPPGFLHLGAVRWSLDPASLLLLSPRLSVSSQWGNQTLNGSLRLRGGRDIDLTDFDMRASADLVQNFAPLAVDGVFSVQLEQLSLREGLPHSARGRAVWQDAGFQSPRGRVPLGSYALDIEQPPGEVLVGDVITLGGPLQAEGRIELRGRVYAINLLLGSDETLDPQLQDALALMAAPEGDRYRVSLKGEF